MKLFSRVLALVLSAFLVAAVVAVPVSAATYRTGANSISSSYKNGPYYANFAKIPLTGDGRLDVLAVALSQLGYEESSSINDLSGLNGSNGYNITEYNYNMGDFGSGYGYYWCATFVAWALYQSQCSNQMGYKDWTRNHTGDSNYIWCGVSCSQWAAQLRRYGYWKNSRSQGGAAYTPQPGDLIFFTWDGAANSEDHIGFVVYSDGTTVYTVEGNTSDASGLDSNGGGVYFKSYSLTASTLAGFGVMPYKTVASAQRIDYSGANPTPGLYMATKLKNIYATEDATDYSWRMARFTMFEVIGVASNGRLKAICTTSDGQTVTGYVKNNEDRVIQLTVTAAPQSEAKQKLGALVNSAKGIKYTDYSAETLNQFYTAYTNAKAVYDNDNSTDAECNAAYNTLNAILANKVEVLSVGKSYTSSAQVRNDTFVDDGLVLTDGTKGYFDGGDTGYAGWQKKAEIVVDLGSAMNSDTYTVYLAGGVWGINLPKIDYYSLEVLYSNSATGTFTSAGKVSEFELKSGSNELENDWTTYTLTLKTDAAINARYIKFLITNAECTGHIWIDEVEVARGGVAASGIYLKYINRYITAGDSNVFTPAIGTMTGSVANHLWSTSVVAKWDATKNGYVVKSIVEGVGSTTPDIAIASDEIVISAHSWEGSSVTDPVAGSEANKKTLMAAKVGQVIKLHGIDLNTKTVYPGAYATISASNTEIGTTPNHLAGTEPDCTNDQYCAACGELLMKAEGHDEGEWEDLDDGSRVCKCTKCGEVIATEDAVATGDVNADGSVDIFDYLLIKNIYFKNHVPTEQEAKRSDVNSDGLIDLFDYMLIKSYCIN